MESLSGTGARVEIFSLWQHFGLCLWVESLCLTSVCHVISDYGSGFLLTSTSTSEPEGVNVMNTQQNALPLSHHSRTHPTLSRDIFPPNCIVFHPETGKIFSDIKSENGIFFLLSSPVDGEQTVFLHPPTSQCSCICKPV